MTFTKEQIRKAMECKTVDELLDYAKSEGIEISREQAEEYIARLGKRKLTDKELATIAAGYWNCIHFTSCGGDCPKEKK